MKNAYKLIFDFLMSMLLILMFRKNVISMSFHEIGGLVLCGMFLIHNIINHKWITGVSKKLFSKTLPLKTKIMYLVNLLLFISVSLVGLTGISMSRTVLTGFSLNLAFIKPLHYFCSALAVILCGVHIGLHLDFIKNVCRLPLISAKHKFLKPLALIAISAIVICGSYNLTASNFSNLLAMPLTSFSQQTSEQHSGNQYGKTSENFNAEHKNRPDNSNAKGNGGKSKQSFSLLSVLSLVGSYLSIIALFALITGIIEKLLKRKKPLLLPVHQYEIKAVNQNEKEQ